MAQTQQQDPATDRPPLEEIRNSIASALPRLAIAGRAAGLENHMQMLADHRRRLLDGHRAQMAALGQPATDPPGDEDMGVHIAGDTNNYITATQPSAATSPISRMLPYVLAAAALAGGGGVGGALLATQLAKPATAVVEQVVQPTQPVTDTDTDTQYELRISSGE